jgi:curli biogenesis system outer membrane secretion channel CsgG
MRPLMSEGTMSKKNPVFLILIGLCFFAACGPTAMVVNTGGPTIEEAQNVGASEKMRIAVSRFENKSQYSVGTGMTDMLVSALFRTNRFIVLERENLDVVMQEQELSKSGAVRKQAAINSGEMEGASFLVLGAVTEFEPNQRGVQTPFGGVKQSHVAIDLRIVDARTSRIVASVTVEGKATDTAIGIGLLKWVGGIPMVMSLSAWNNTPMDKAIRICLDKAVDYIVTTSLGKGAGK